MNPPAAANPNPTSPKFWHSFRMAAWLGWQIESNWTDPFLFAIYSIIRPLAAASILVVMYAVITNANFADPMFSYIYLGNAFYAYVGQILTGMAWSIIDDREHYKTLKYIYVAPLHFPTYLLGRAVARFVITSLSVFITILFGVLFLQVRLDLAQVDWLLFFFSLLVGVIMLAMLGLMLAGLMLLLARHSDGVGEAVGGALYLFSGAVFPLEILPAFLRPVGYVIPIAYWLELLRRALVGEVAQAFPTFSNLSNGQLVAILLGLTALFSVLGGVVFKACDRRAREYGLIDVTTNY